MSATVACHHGFDHSAVFYDGTDALVDRVACEVVGALDAGNPVMVSLADDKRDLVAEAIGPDVAAMVTFFAAGDRYARPVVALQKVADWVADSLAGGAAEQVVGIGEIVLDGFVPPAEWMRYEVAATEMFRHLPTDFTCLYDTGAVADDVLEAARVAHPPLTPNDTIFDCAGLLSPARPLPAVAGVPAALVEPLISAASAREQVRSTLTGVITEDAVGDAELVVSELAGNALRHGRQPIALRIWIGPEVVDLEVRDQGSGLDDPIAGLRMPDAEPGGMGLWISGTLSDRLRSGPCGDGWAARASFLRR